MEVGGGINFKRKQFLQLVDAILAGQIERVVLAHQDRLARFGYTLLGSSLPDPSVRISGHQYGRTQPRARIGAGFNHYYPLFFQPPCTDLRNYRKALKKAIADDQGAQDPVTPDT